MRLPPTSVSADLASAVPELTDADLETSIPARFATVVAQVPPEHLAYRGADGELTYQRLDQLSDHWAAKLVDRLGHGRPGAQAAVVTLAPHGAISLIGLLAVLKAGHFYVPLDADVGDGYAAQIVADCAPKVVLTTRDLLSQAQRWVGAAAQTDLMMIDAASPALDLGFAGARVSGQMIASVLYTSGSTGRPRGVMHTHGQNLLAAYLSAHEGRYDSGARVAHLASYAYAFSTAVVFGALLTGATLYGASVTGMTPAALYEWLQVQQISVLQCAPSVLRNLAAVADDVPLLPSLFSVATGMEPLSRETVQSLARVLPAGCRLLFRLGSTEVGIVAQFIIHVGDTWTGDWTPAGYPPAHTEVFIADDSGRPIAPGEPGQICVRSRFLSAGYWNLPEDTAARFLPDPQGGDRRIFLTGDRGRLRPDGCLEYLGRQDLMVKIRGYRVEPEAVERVLLAHPAIRECAVAPRPQSSGEQRLIAYLVCHGGDCPSASQLRAFLTASLPAYMAPARFVALASLPRTVNGKLDRQALPPPGATRPALDTPFAAPRSDVECRLADIWATLLELDEVGVNDSFFELGGDSLLLLRMNLEIEAQFQQQLPPNYVHAPTIAVLARALAGEPLALEAPALHPYAIRQRRSRFKRLLGGDVGAGRAAGAAFRRGATEIALRLDYAQGVRWLAWWCGQPLVQGLVFRYERDLLLRLAEGLGMPTPDHGARQLFLLNFMLLSALQQLPAKQPLQHMAASRHRFWHALAKERDLSEKPAWVHFDGRERFEQAYNQGRGVMLVTYHSTTRGLGSELLSHLTPGQSVFVPSQAVGRKRARFADAEAWRAAGSDPNPGLRAREIAWSAAQGMDGLRTLRAGGVVLIIPDGAMADMPGAQQRAVGDRAYRIGPGFAELALSCQAPILPMVSRFERSGAIRITFLPPLHPALAPATRPAQVAGLVTQYAHFLAEAWRAAPESLPAGQIASFLQQPRAASDQSEHT